MIWHFDMQAVAVVQLLLQPLLAQQELHLSFVVSSPWYFVVQNFGLYGFLQNFGLPKQKVVKMNFSIHESPALSPWATAMAMKDAWMG